MLTAVSAWAALRADVSLIAAVSASYSLARASGNEVALNRGMYQRKNAEIGSTIPCEGSRTGFYTDDYNEQDYKSPEEIRKAS